MGIDGRSFRSTREIVLWLAIACILVAGIGLSWRPTPFAHGLAAIFIACAVVHAAVLYGTRPAIVLFGMCVAITFAMENIGVAAGFPFGRYHFAIDADLPRIGTIPIQTRSRAGSCTRSPSCST
jgi:putative membrane protein